MSVTGQVGCISADCDTEHGGPSNIPLAFSGLIDAELRNPGDRSVKKSQSLVALPSYESLALAPYRVARSLSFSTCPPVAAQHQ
jgi:hypothetical protein